MSLRLLPFLVLLLITLSGMGRAHVVEQLYAEILSSGPEWQVEVLFDAGYAKPEWRGDPDSPQPTRDWLLSLPEGDQLALCQEADRYINECLRFHSQSGPIKLRSHFIDFDQDPPDFPSLLTGGAYFRILLTPAEADPYASVTVTLADGERPDFVFKSDVEGGYTTLEPGDSFLLSEGGTPPLSHAFQQGFVHVLPKGLDHILFILCLFLLQRSWKPLLWQSLAFTAAHTLTLGLGAAGILSAPAGWIEPIIALSIAALAIENLFLKEFRPWRLPLVFAFGLVHGLGFASALASTLAPGDSFLPRLIATNLGVEVAQVAVLATAWLLTVRWHSSTPYEPLRKAANGVIAMLALFWFVERIVSG